ncbi:MAG TPA: DUF4832 domain-containing protein [Terriglobia bacterium]|nr:DUF4832 domain-containing protein [Terriglobia bacterium]
MIRMKIPAVAAALMLSAALVFAQNDSVIVRPKEIDTVLVNPGMGIQTFQRFNGDALNSGLRWSEEGPTAVLQPAAEKPDFPGSSISYCRWFWNVLEPEHGKYDWRIIDSALEQARLHHQTLAIRMMPYDERHPLPEWYRNSGARRANKPTDEDGNIWQPDFSDPLYLKYWGELVAAAGARYDGNPNLEMVDISSVGYWGEGWSHYMPAFKYQKALIDIYLDAFKRTPLLMNFDQAHALSYAVKHGSGWRLDCWGDMGMLEGEKESGRSLMMDRYPEQVVEAGIEDAWTRSPVSLESCGVAGTWLKFGYDVNYILDQALRWHVSSVNIKSSAIPPQWKEQFEEFEKKMSYRFILRRLEYPKEVRPGEMMPVSMWFLNAGVAPVYRDYILAVELSSPDGKAIIKTPADVRKWLPGDAMFDGTLFVPETLKPGEYHFRVGLLDPRTEQPAIKLAIEGRQPDGWYDLGTIGVQ